ncbi:unnamed protein product [Adineta steineri]|uniref:Uncharacterized protein n=1 Tax=Adineta steineri TaxID=433720 RepID=A0A814YVR4_9BILA|nr:unnamed protein product [Adineta steineri]CAF1249227.1 unnamed protein product [Adineta steineri]CAF1549601.1 unnamed protein product [Adineta steineri]
MSMIIFFLFCFIPISNCDITCRTTSWWVLQPFPKSLLQQFLDESKVTLTFNTSNPLARFMQDDEHPVYFEFNKQNDCEYTALPPILANITEQTFVEFKLEIPYLIQNNKNIMLKPLLYQNSLLNVFATHVVYGLPANFATMNADFDKNTYSISYEKGLVDVSFEPLIPNLVPFGSPGTANFSSFVDANVSPWLAFPFFSLSHNTKCASNIYNFTAPALIRPVKMVLNITGNILEAIPSGTYTNEGNHPLGAWQIDVPSKITSTYGCD